MSMRRSKRNNVPKAQEEDKEPTPLKKMKPTLVLPSDLDKPEEGAYKISDEMYLILRRFISHPELRASIFPNEMKRMCTNIIDGFKSRNFDMSYIKTKNFYTYPEAIAYAGTLGTNAQTLQKELTKYMVIACTELQELPLDVTLNMITAVCDLPTVFRYMPGFPPLPPKNTHTMANISEKEFNNLPRGEREQLTEQWLGTIESFLKSANLFVETYKDIPDHQMAEAHVVIEKASTSARIIKERLMKKKDSEAELFIRFRAAAIERDAEKAKEKNLTFNISEERECEIKRMYESLDAETLDIICKL